MALRLGRLMDAAVRSLSDRPDVLLLDATARDHPRRAGLALHLGVELNLPSIGVTHRPLVATGTWPNDERGATSPLMVGSSVVGCWLRTQAGVRPLAVHPGWRIDLATAVAVVMSVTGRHRTPEPLRRARQLARRARGAS
jgi:deoxyribonuclease V